MIPRYSSRVFPPYAHLPGSGSPHPTRDPAGHSFGIDETVPPFAIAAWQGHDQYRHGIDLHNHGYHWECHETLEGVWRTMDLASPGACFVQALIQLTVAHSHVLRRKPDTACKLAGWALDKLTVHRGVVAGIEVEALCREIDAWRAHPATGGGAIILRLLA